MNENVPAMDDYWTRSTTERLVDFPKIQTKLFKSLLYVWFISKQMFTLMLELELN